MLPILRDRIYVIDFEVKPLPQYEDKKFSTYESDEAEDTLDIDSPNFLPWTSEIYGLGVSWGPDLTTESKYFTGQNIRKTILFLSTNKLKLAAHNVLFDWVNAYYHFELPLNFVSDSGVISQCINNSDAIRSFGLKQTTERLYNVITQDKELKDYLKDKYKIAAGNYGKYIHLCPEEMIEKYCRLDAHYCWRIINDSPKWLKSDISIYMKLYINQVKLTIQQFLNGIKINKEGFEHQKSLLSTEIAKIERLFLEHDELKTHIENVQKIKFKKAQGKLKTKILNFEKWSTDEKNKFNINSSQQLKYMFDSQKLHFNEKKQVFEYPYINTFTGTRINNPNSPKLGTKFLHAYGVGGEILGDKGEKVTLLSHIERALDEASITGRIHPHVNLLGTASGRISASGVNIIATPVSDPAYGKNLIADEGWSVLCKDFKSLEPTILACLSGDPVMQYVTFHGEGKEPFIKDDILWIDDTYISAAYGASFMRSTLMENLNLSNWVKDPEGEKKKIKGLRSASKTMVLSTNYGAGAAKIQQRLREELKLHESLQNVQAFQIAYDSTFAVAAQYKRSLIRQAESDGYIINSGGFPLIFYDRPDGIIQGTHKAPNRRIQSDAAFVMMLLLYFVYKKLKNRKDVIPAVPNWHDACWFYVRDEVIDEIDFLIEEALVDLNNTLKWPLKLRLDKNVGKTFYDCK